MEWKVILCIVLIMECIITVVWLGQHQGLYNTKPYFLLFSHPWDSYGQSWAVRRGDRKRGKDQRRRREEHWRKELWE